MELIEVKEKQGLNREDVATRPRELAGQLPPQRVAFNCGGAQFRAHVPDEVGFDFEFETEDDGTGLEIEMSW